MDVGKDLSAPFDRSAGRLIITNTARLFGKILISKVVAGAPASLAAGVVEGCCVKDS